MSPETRGWVFLIGESVAIFAVSVLVLFIVYTLIDHFRNRATGIVVVNMKGYVLIAVGVLYIVFGFWLTRLTRAPWIPQLPNQPTVSNQPIPFPSDNPEALEAIGHIKCPICQRPFSEHSLDEGRKHWDQMHAGLDIKSEGHIVLEPKDAPDPK